MKASMSFFSKSSTLSSSVNSRVGGNSLKLSKANTPMLENSSTILDSNFLPIF
jgi:hypothetical protein